MTFKELEICIGGLLILIAIFMGVGKAVRVERPEVARVDLEKTFVAAPQSPLSQMTFASTTVKLLIADTEEAREKGLGGRDGLASDEGMLFVFPQAGFYSFWMKDMRFAIDILWLDEHCTIVYLKKNVPPVPEDTIFTPNKKSFFVAEVSAGFVDKNHLTIGDRCILELYKK